MQYHLQGILRQSGDRLRLNVSLSERFIGQQIWAEHYEYQLVDAFSVQDEIARQIASAVENQLYATESASARLQSPKNLSAWQCIVRALLLISTRNKAEVKAAEELLTRAISIDPKSASAYSLHSFVSTLRVHLGWQTRRQALPHALRTAEKARALNPDEPWAHLALGYALTHSRPDKALEPLEHGLTLDPNLSMAHYLIAFSSTFLGDYEKAFTHAQMAERLRSYDLLARGNVGTHDNVRATACIVAGRYREGMEFAHRVITQSPRQTPAFRSFIVNAACAGEREQAASAFESLRRLTPVTQKWLDEFSQVWSRREHYQKYVEAFRTSGLG
jgi:tetratricopeptide (TPR) repeat protein